VSLDEVLKLNKKEFCCDDERKNFFLGGKPSGANYINDVCCPISLINCRITEKFEYNNIIYENAMIFENTFIDGPMFSEATYRLNGFYKKLKFELIKLSEVDYESTLFWILSEDDIFLDLKSFGDMEKIELDVADRQEITLYFLSTRCAFSYAVVNIMLE